MADSTLYLDSMLALSTALDKIMALTKVRYQINEEFVRIPSSPGHDSKEFLDILFEAMPRVSKLQNEEKELAISVKDNINKSLLCAINYILSFENADISDVTIGGLQKHLQLLYEVISAKYLTNIEGVSVEADLFQQAINKLNELQQTPQSINVIGKLIALNDSINLLYVGKK